MYKKFFTLFALLTGVASLLLFVDGVIAYWLGLPKGIVSKTAAFKDYWFLWVAWFGWIVYYLYHWTIETLKLFRRTK